MFLSTIEILGVLFGLSYIITMIYEKWYSWPLGIIAVSLYAYSCYHFNLYGEFSLQFIYIILAIKGWIEWTKPSRSLKVEYSSFQELVFYFLFSILSVILFYFILQFFNGDLIFWDALSNGLSITATLMATRKKIENWILWIPINLLIIFIMFSKGMNFYAFLYFAYGLFAVIGLKNWLKIYQIEKN